jgi:hypothetical protein
LSPQEIPIPLLLVLPSQNAGNICQLLPVHHADVLVEAPVDAPPHDQKQAENRQARGAQDQEEQAVGNSHLHVATPRRHSIQVAAGRQAWKDVVPLPNEQFLISSLFPSH